MDKTFDELYEEFFNENNGKFDVKKLTDMLSSVKILDTLDDDMINAMDATLGEPDSVDYYIEDDLYYEKRTWNTDKGILVKIIIRDEPPAEMLDEGLEQSFSEPMTTQELLDIALESEDYESAAYYRDIIKNEKKKK